VSKRLIPRLRRESAFGAVEQVDQDLLLQLQVTTSDVILPSGFWMFWLQD
jgi:hypothetical protein